MPKKPSNIDAVVLDAGKEFDLLTSFVYASEEEVKAYVGARLIMLEVNTGRARKEISIIRRHVETVRKRMYDLNFTKFNNLWSDRMYSSYYLLKHIPTGELYELYTYFHWWCIGGHGGNCTALGQLMELLLPKEYAGYSDKNCEDILLEQKGKDAEMVHQAREQSFVQPVSIIDDLTGKETDDLPF